jgi:hypothetical protein
MKYLVTGILHLNPACMIILGPNKSVQALYGKFEHIHIRILGPNKICTRSVQFKHNHIRILGPNKICTSLVREI